MNEGLSFNVQWTFWQLYCGKNKLNFDEMIMSALYWTNTLSYIFIVVTLWSNGMRVDISLHSNTLLWFQAIQVFVFTPYLCVLSRETRHTNISVGGFINQVLGPKIYRTRSDRGWPNIDRCKQSEHTNRVNYTNDYRLHDHELLMDY